MSISNRTVTLRALEKALDPIADLDLSKFSSWSELELNLIARSVKLTRPLAEALMVAASSYETMFYAVCEAIRDSDEFCRYSSSLHFAELAYTCVSSSGLGMSQLNGIKHNYGLFEEAYGRSIYPNYVPPISMRDCLLNSLAKRSPLLPVRLYAANSWIFEIHDTWFPDWLELYCLNLVKANPAFASVRALFKEERRLQ